MKKVKWAIRNKNGYYLSRDFVSWEEDLSRAYFLRSRSAARGLRGDGEKVVKVLLTVED